MNESRSNIVFGTQCVPHYNIRDFSLTELEFYYIGRKMELEENWKKKKLKKMSLDVFLLLNNTFKFHSY